MVPNWKVLGWNATLQDDGSISLVPYSTNESVSQYESVILEVTSNTLVPLEILADFTVGDSTHINNIHFRPEINHKSVWRINLLDVLAENVIVGQDNFIEVILAIKTEERVYESESPLVFNIYRTSRDTEYNPSDIDTLFISVNKIAMRLVDCVDRNGDIIPGDMKFTGNVSFEAGSTLDISETAITSRYPEDPNDLATKEYVDNIIGEAGLNELQEEIRDIKENKQDILVDNITKETNLDKAVNFKTIRDKISLIGPGNVNEILLKEDIDKTVAGLDSNGKLKESQIPSKVSDKLDELDRKDSDLSSKIDAINEKIPTQASKSNQLADKKYVQDNLQKVQDIAEDAREKSSGFDDRIEALENVVPSQASKTNQLADKAFVNSTLQTATANFRGSWNTWSAVPSYESSYPTDYLNSRTPTTNDYIVVLDASGYSSSNKGTWRFKYTGTWASNGKNGWKPEYQVNEEPLTAAQVAALNSGVTKEKISSIDSEISKEVKRATDKENAIETNLSNLSDVVEGHTSEISDINKKFDDVDNRFDDLGELSAKDKITEEDIDGTISQDKIEGLAEAIAGAGRGKSVFTCDEELSAKISNTVSLLKSRIKPSTDMKEGDLILQTNLTDTTDDKPYICVWEIVTVQSREDEDFDVLGTLVFKTPQDYVTKQWVEELLEDKADKQWVEEKLEEANIASETYVDEKISESLTGYAKEMYVDGKIAEHMEVLATEDKNGHMSAEDKKALDAVNALMTDDDDEFVNKITEVLEIFENYPEGSNILEVLDDKANKEWVQEKIDEVEAIAGADFYVDNSEYRFLEDNPVGNKRVLSAVYKKDDVILSPNSTRYSEEEDDSFDDIGGDIPKETIEDKTSPAPSSIDSNYWPSDFQESPGLTKDEKGQVTGVENVTDSRLCINSNIFFKYSTWKINENVTEVYFGPGCKQIDSTNAPGILWMIFEKGNIRRIVFHESSLNGVIPYYLFGSCKALEEVILPKNAIVEDRAFSSCEKLVSINLENAVEIGSYAFANNKALKSVTIGQKCEEIYSKAFYGCTSLETLYWNAENCYIESATTDEVIFNGCTNLKNIVVGENASIPERLSSNIGYIDTVYWNATNCSDFSSTYPAFRNINSLQTLVIGENVEYIPAYLIGSGTSLKNIYLNSIQCGVGGNFINSTTALEKVYIGSKVQSIEDGIFNVPIKEVHISNIENWCNTDFKTAKANPLYRGVNLYYGNTLLENITLPDTVTTIKQYTFYGCKSLRSVKIPSTVTQIGKDAFYGNNLESISLPLSNTLSYIFDSNGTNLPSKLTHVEITGGTVPADALAKCNSIEKVKVSANVVLSTNAFAKASKVYRYYFESSVPINFSDKIYIGEEGYLSDSTKSLAIYVPAGESASYRGLNSGWMYVDRIFGENEELGRWLTLWKATSSTEAQCLYATRTDISSSGGVSKDYVDSVVKNLPTKSYVDTLSNIIIYKDIIGVSTSDIVGQSRPLVNDNYTVGQTVLADNIVLYNGVGNPLDLVSLWKITEINKAGDKATAKCIWSIPKSQGGSSGDADQILDVQIERVGDSDDEPVNVPVFDGTNDGLVPKPDEVSEDKFLTASGTWKKVSAGGGELPENIVTSVNSQTGDVTITAEDIGVKDGATIESIEIEQTGDTDDDTPGGGGSSIPSILADFENMTLQEIVDLKEEHGCRIFESVIGKKIMLDTSAGKLPFILIGAGSDIITDATSTQTNILTARSSANSLTFMCGNAIPGTADQTSASGASSYCSTSGLQRSNIAEGFTINDDSLVKRAVKVTTDWTKGSSSSSYGSVTEINIYAFKYWRLNIKEIAPISELAYKAGGASNVSTYYNRVCDNPTLYVSASTTSNASQINSGLNFYRYPGNKPYQYFETTSFDAIYTNTNEDRIMYDTEGVARKYVIASLIQVPYSGDAYTAIINERGSQYIAAASRLSDVYQVPCFCV